MGWNVVVDEIVDENFITILTHSIIANAVKLVHRHNSSSQRQRWIYRFLFNSHVMTACNSQLE